MYEAAINRKNPGAFVFLVDQSGSTGEDLGGGVTLASRITWSLNKMISDLVLKCTKSDGIRDYFDVAVLTYCGDGVGSGFGGELSDEFFHPISEIGNHPLRLEEDIKEIHGPAGDSGTIVVRKPIWFEPYAQGTTPMFEAFERAGMLLGDWCDNHPDSYPPVLINITDGVATDKDPEELARLIRALCTNDGAVQVYNLHLGLGGFTPVCFADSEMGLPDENASRLFRMSSLLTQKMRELAAREGYEVSVGSRGYAYNADISDLIRFLDIGTRAVPLR